VTHKVLVHALVVYYYGVVLVNRVACLHNELRAFGHVGRRHGGVFMKVTIFLFSNTSLGGSFDYRLL
jgi:hypothetical protein